MGSKPDLRVTYSPSREVLAKMMIGSSDDRETRFFLVSSDGRKGEILERYALKPARIDRKAMSRVRGGSRFALLSWSDSDLTAGNVDVDSLRAPMVWRVAQDGSVLDSNEIEVKKPDPTTGFRAARLKAGSQGGRVSSSHSRESFTPVSSASASSGAMVATPTKSDTAEGIAKGLLDAGVSDGVIQRYREVDLDNLTNLINRQMSKPVEEIVNSPEVQDFLDEMEENREVDRGVQVFGKKRSGSKARMGAGGGKGKILPVDVSISNEGTVWAFRDLSDDAKAWLEENVEIEDFARMGNGIVFDWRMGNQVANAMIDWGFSVEIDGQRVAGRRRVSAEDQGPTQRKVVVRQEMDTTEVKKRNPKWPEKKVLYEGPAEIRGDKQGIWVDGELRGFVGHNGWSIVSDSEKG